MARMTERITQMSSIWGSVFLKVLTWYNFFFTFCWVQIVKRSALLRTDFKGKYPRIIKEKKEEKQIYIFEKASRYSKITWPSKQV